MLETGDVLRVGVAIGTGDQVVGYNVWHWGVVQGGSDTDDAFRTALTSKLGGMYGAIASIVASPYSLIRAEIYLENRDYVVADIYPTATFTGTGDPLPSGVALLLQFTTSFRRVSGRKYLFGMTEGQVAGNSWASGARTAAENMAVAYEDDVAVGTASNLLPGVYSRGPNLLRPISGHNAVLVPAYQRRRRPPHLQ